MLLLCCSVCYSVFRKDKEAVKVRLKFVLYSYDIEKEATRTGKAEMNMKFFRNRERKDVKIYVPKKEKIQRLQQQTMIMNRAIIGA